MEYAYTALHCTPDEALDRAPWPGTLTEYGEWRRLKVELQERAIELARLDAAAKAALGGAGQG